MIETIGWMIALAVLLLIEMATLSLTTIWFAVGALFASIASLLGCSVTIQFIVFLIVSLIVLVLMRPSAVKYFNQKRVKTNYESIIGLDAKVIETVDNNEPSGVAMVNGQEWMARAVIDDMVIPAGTKAKVIKIVGVKLILSNQKEEI